MFGRIRGSDGGGKMRRGRETGRERGWFGERGVEKDGHEELRYELI